MPGSRGPGQARRRAHGPPARALPLGSPPTCLPLCPLSAGPGLITMTPFPSSSSPKTSQTSLPSLAARHCSCVALSSLGAMLFWANINQAARPGRAGKALPPPRREEPGLKEQRGPSGQSWWKLSGPRAGVAGARQPRGMGRSRPGRAGGVGASHLTLGEPGKRGASHTGERLPSTPAKKTVSPR